MSGISKKLMGTTAAGGGLEIAIEEVFSTYLYTGNGSTQTITNGIDLAGEGGLVWLKNRDFASNHILTDSERGINSQLRTNETGGAENNPTIFDSFNSDGFSIDLGNSNTNGSGENYASWTFRKAPRFFDVVTYTGDGVAGRTISHNLGTDVGTLIVKRVSDTSNWTTWHRSLANNQIIALNSTSEAYIDSAFFSTPPSTTVFTVGNTSSTNASGDTYVAYLYAHDPLGPSGDGSDGLIACGSYSGGGAGVNVTVNLGWEPQWILVKNTSATNDWYIVDTMRGLTVSADERVLSPNLSAAEDNKGCYVPTATGFYTDSNAPVNISGNTYIYIAIRRGPMRAPESGTEVFATQAYTGDNTFGRYLSGVAFPPDAFWATDRDGYEDWYNFDRLRGAAGKELKFNSTAAEGAYSDDVLDSFTMDGIRFDTTQSSILNGSSGIDYISYFLRRAPGFFDVVAYTGNGTAGRTVPHNLGVAPEMMIVKRRSGVSGWSVYTAPTGNSSWLQLESVASVESSVLWAGTTPTSEVFYVTDESGKVNASSETYIAYLFATLAGISKVGSYTGNGSSQTIDCGFTSGARFVLIKKTSSADDWLVHDSARGIITGVGDPSLRLNNTDPERSNTNYIDPHSSGFTLATGENLTNQSGQTYIFYAIA